MPPPCFFQSLGAWCVTLAGLDASASAALSAYGELLRLGRDYYYCMIFGNSPCHLCRSHEHGSRVSGPSEPSHGSGKPSFWALTALLGFASARFLAYHMAATTPLLPINCACKRAANDHHKTPAYRRSCAALSNRD